MSKNTSMRYVQLSVPAFIKAYPLVALQLSPSLIAELLSDPDYVVRFSPVFGQLEFGFFSDDWLVLK